MEELLILDPFDELFIVWNFVIEFAHCASVKAGRRKQRKGSQAQRRLPVPESPDSYTRRLSEVTVKRGLSHDAGP